MGTLKEVYTLSSEQEPKRLEEQSRLINYSLERELNSQDMQISAHWKILDAGCGTGLLSRYLIDCNKETQFNVDAVDFDDRNLYEAKKQFALDNRYNGQVNLLKGDIAKLDKADNYYHKIFCRYVFQHLPVDKPKKVAEEFYRVLQKNGTATIIDAYGIMFEIDTPNIELRGLLADLKDKIPLDPYVGMKLRGYFIDAGFAPENIEMQVDCMYCDKESERLAEVKLFTERLNHVKPILIEAFGQEMKATRFINLYISEIKKERTLLFPHKVVIRARK